MFSCKKAPAALFILFQQVILNCHLSCCWRLSAQQIIKTIPVDPNYTIGRRRCTGRSHALVFDRQTPPVTFFSQKIEGESPTPDDMPLIFKNTLFIQA